jgi:hypothetical protein
MHINLQRLRLSTPVPASAGISREGCVVIITGPGTADKWVAIYQARDSYA